MQGAILKLWVPRSEKDEGSPAYSQDARHFRGLSLSMKLTLETRDGWWGWLGGWVVRRVGVGGESEAPGRLKAAAFAHSGVPENPFTLARLPTHQGINQKGPCA